MANLPHPGGAELVASRRTLILESAGIIVSSGGFGFVFGLAARQAGLSLPDATAMSLFVFAGAAQFAALGYLAGGLAWPGIVLLTGLLNARHLFYSVALAPWLADRPRRERAAMAFWLTDESFALSLAHFRRLGRGDRWGYWFAVVFATFIPWNVAATTGVLVGGSIPDPNAFGIDVIFPAAMGGLAVLMRTARADVGAAMAGVAIAVGTAVAAGSSIGILAGGLVAPLVGIAIKRRGSREGAGNPAP